MFTLRKIGDLHVQLCARVHVHEIGDLRCFAVYQDSIRLLAVAS